MEPKITQLGRWQATFFVVLSLCSFSFGLCQGTQPDTQLYESESENGFKHIWEGSLDDRTFRNGSYLILFNGDTVMTGTYERNVRSGEWKYYHANGRLSSQGDFTDRKQGLWNFFYSNGQVSAIGQYDSGFRTGTWTGYYSSGEKAITIEYNSGRIMGLEMFFKNGLTSLRRSFEYTDNDLTMTEELYSDPGIRRLEYTATINEWDRVKSEMEESGVEVDLDIFFGPSVDEHFLKESPWVPHRSMRIYHPNGVLAEHRSYVYGRFDSYFACQDIWGNNQDKGTLEEGNGITIHYNNLGQVVRTQHYRNGVPHGLVEVYRDNEKLLYTGYFNEGEPDSTWRFYDLNVQLTGEYKIDGDDIDVRELVANQSVTITGQYSDELPTGEWISIDFLKDTLMLVNYKKGMRHGPFSRYRSGIPELSGQFEFDVPTGEWQTQNLNLKETWARDYPDSIKYSPSLYTKQHPFPTDYKRMSFPKVEQYSLKTLAGYDWCIGQSPFNHRWFTEEDQFGLARVRINDSGELETMSILRYVDGDHLEWIYYTMFHGILFRPWKFMGIPIESSVYIIPECLLPPEEE